MMLLSLDFGPHAVFIILSYAVTFLGVFMIIGWMVWDYRQQKKLLAKLGSDPK